MASLRLCVKKTMKDHVLITPLTPDDWPAVRAIYAEGIATGQATFETAVPDWAAWDAARTTIL